MKQASVVLSTLLLAISIVSASKASAAIVNVTYTGTVASGVDEQGLFGAPNTSLVGDSYIAQYTFDTAVGFTFSTPTQNYAYGGDNWGNASPALSTTVTINGVSVTYVGNNVGSIEGRND